MLDARPFTYTLLFPADDTCRITDVFIEAAFSTANYTSFPIFIDIFSLSLLLHIFFILQQLASII